MPTDADIGDTGMNYVYVYSGVGLVVIGVFIILIIIAMKKKNNGKTSMETMLAKSTMAKSAMAEQGKTTNDSNIIYRLDSWS